ncbi:ABC transporter substrate-binding protein [Kribbella turkmenica]|nr:extracellular solute-binding protein [Kribbella turkmenica]
MGVGASGLLAASGCSSSPPRPDAGGDADAKLINFYGDSLGGETTGKFWKRALERFETDRGVTVKPVTYTFDQAPTQLLLAARSGNASGVGEAGPWQVLVPLGVLADLSEIASKHDYPKALLDGFTVDGRLYVLPQYVDAIGLVGNGSILSSVGFTGDKVSVDDFAATLEKIKAQDRRVIPYAGATKQPALKDLIPWMWTFGSEVITADLKVTLGDAASVKVLEWYKQLVSAGLIGKEVHRDDARVLLAQGRTALYDDVGLARSFAKTNGAPKPLQDGLLSITRPALKADGDSYNRGSAGGLFVFAGAGEATSRGLAEWICTDPALAGDFFTLNSRVTALSSVASAIPEIGKDRFQTSWNERSIGHARFPAYNRLPTSAALDDLIGQGVAKILAGEQTSQEGLNALRAKVQKQVDDSK